MSDVLLPNYFEHKLQKDPEATVPLAPCSFDAITQEFVINERRVHASDFDPQDLGTTNLEDSVKVTELFDHALFLPVSFAGVTLATPRLHDFPLKHPEVFKDIITIMTTVYQDLSEDAQSGFGAKLIQEGVCLHVPGTCACLGPDPSGKMIKGQFEYGFAEYGLHNADTRIQRVSLYAGLGHLAFLADGTPSRQGTLF